ncbi:hypothetical protein [Gorillibacterium timonense]|uniref:hypothetical protein n=1 Tax=Gorillibacterium timonense TaxID=1689269 RepID=UPI00071C99CF|nr:hypothetical protein [Gorillibacterium timonense]
MRALVAFLLKDFYRSHRYFIPMFCYVGFVGWLYTIVPNPVLESYSTTSTLLYAITAWLTLNLLRSEPVVQGQLSILHVGKRIRYEWARLAAAGLLVTGLSLFATFYPLLRGAFQLRPSGAELLTGFYSHLSLSLLMISLVWVIEGDGKRNYMNNLFLLILFIALSIGGQGILAELPESLRFAGWILPPVFRVNDALLNSDVLSTGEYLTKLAAPIWYSMLLLGLGFVRLRKQ